MTQKQRKYEPKMKTANQTKAEAQNKGNRKIIDHSFKFLLETNRTRMEFLEFALEEIATLVDPESFEAVSESIIHADGSETIEDVLFRARLKSDSTQGFEFLVLVAHQSRPDKHMSLRILEVLVSYWARQIRNAAEDKKLTLIVPVLVYTGAKGWNLKTLKQLVKEGFKASEVSEESQERLLSFVPDFKLQVVKLRDNRAEYFLNQKTEVGFFLAFLRSLHQDDFRKNLLDILKAMTVNEIGILKGRLSQYMNLMIHTVLEKRPSEDQAFFEEQTKSLASEKKESLTMFKTAAQVIREEQEKKQIQSFQKMLLEIVAKKFSASERIELQEQIASIQSIEELQKINMKIALSTKIEEVFPNTT